MSADRTDFEILLDAHDQAPSPTTRLALCQYMTRITDWLDVTDANYRTAHLDLIAERKLSGTYRKLRHVLGQKLAKYGQHLDDCSGTPCTCGLSADELALVDRLR